MSLLRSEKLPSWMRRSLPEKSTSSTYGVLAQNRLNTVCESALCPNISECFSRHTATFLILGSVCTRGCGFCHIKPGSPAPADPGEPERLALAAEELGLDYVVMTSVTRDDLADEGAMHFASCVRAVKERLPRARVEVLTPDFHARPELIAQVTAAEPDVYNHNIETVERLYPAVRPKSDYGRSLEVLRRVKDLEPEMLTKSGMMLGLGETREEILETASDLRDSGCDILTIGQYLRPSPAHCEVAVFVTPQEFLFLREELKSYGFRSVLAGPYVRSSYCADDIFRESLFNGNSKLREKGI